MNRKEKFALLLRGWGYSLVVAVVIAMTFRSAVAELNLVPTGSMIPTILEGDRIVVNKLSYDLKIPFTTCHIAVWDHPEPGDIVVFFSPADEKRLVKRVVGVPGDTLSMRNNRLYINGKPLEYEALESNGLYAADRTSEHLFFSENLEGKKHPVMLTPFRPSARTFASLKVPEGYYFMMGDNRDNSSDSRYFGFVGRDRIVGRAVGVAVSLSQDEYFCPRWHRFFSRLN